MPNKAQKQTAALKCIVWGTELDAVPPWKTRLIGAARILRLVLRDLMEGQLTLRSMSLVYTTLLSLAPLIAVSFSVLKGFGVHNQVEPILLNLLAPLGEKGVEITNRIIEFVDNIKAGYLGSLGLGLLIFAAISLVQKIERAFNYTWRVTKHRPFGRRFGNYLSVILIGPVLVFTAIGITATITHTAVVQQLMSIEAFGTLIRFGTRLLPYMLVITAFTITYAFVPNTKVKARSAFIGALVAGTLWETTGWGFTVFIASSGNLTAIYSTLATLILFMIWIQLGWLILLIGASIAFYHQHPEHRILEHRKPHLSSRMKEKLALMIMALIARNFYKKEPPWTNQTLAQHLRLPVDAITPLTECLITTELIAHANAPHSGFLPAKSPENLGLKEIISAARQIGESDYFDLEQLPQDVQVDNVCANLEQSMHNSLHEKTIKQLLPAD